MGENIYVEELKKFVGKEVVIKDNSGEIYEGKCKAINFMHLNVVLMTGEEKILLKNPQIIRRKRDSVKKKNE